eukprot:TRINITY_DN381_c0_g1_i3.p1 TRINITY_DN381_c0_g1~~TRINITY_DN381_c0_g1_i3.p1  ORF type:complete len:277 (+),score=16.79 TRINITY_DN381_c0_g1_i3:105-935(+)
MLRSLVGSEMCIRDRNGTIWSQGWVEGSHGCIYQGSWIAEWAMRNATRFKQIFDREIKTLADHYGVGPEATMVQLTCQIVNTFERIQAYTFYSIELMPSGEVRPMEPNVILASFPFSSPDVTFFPLVLAFYILCEEMQDVITDGYAEYFVSAGFLNLFDWLTIGMLLLLWLFESIYVGSIPAVNTVWQIRLDSFWTLGTVQAHWQTILGLACFSMITKVPHSQTRGHQALCRASSSPRTCPSCARSATRSRTRCSLLECCCSWFSFCFLRSLSCSR